MVYTRKIVGIIGLWLMLLLAFNVNRVVDVKIQQLHSSSLYTEDQIGSSAFMQPQANPSIILINKVNDYICIKWLGEFLDKIQNTNQLNPYKSHASQDINRCEMVSLLLFPFHIFW
ncbi:hypothetical protein [Flavobacterium psychrotolerans]|uniref:Uncharacterized protein n=1 Tax=Flavobacterium psychrotolerans TaxID=2169410 RepID=A0A2U1JLU1_9FLAO|nr:hypothetical protein [Flavobacterium psychrotolerans]PWA06112.1 hypothetical protein DB895_04205 [Flavobacterium psychrotolerans]